MNRFKIACLVICILAFGFFANTAFAKKVVIISGVAEKNVTDIGYNLIHDGIKEVFSSEGTTLEFQYIALEKKGEKEEAGMAAVARAKASNPDLVITINDDCLKYVGMKFDNIPVVFAYIFGKPASFGLPKANVTGVTRRSYAADIWALANKLLGVKTVALMSKDSVSMQNVRKYLFAGADKLEAASGVRYKEMYLINTFEDWEKSVKAFPEDFIYLADTSRIKKGDKTLTREETTSWTVANSSKPVIAATERDVAAGAMFAIVTSERAIGINAAEIAKKILAGTAPSEIKYVQSKKGKLVVNMKTAQQYKIEIPYDILSSAEKVYE